MAKKARKNILAEYLPADKSFTVNDRDPDLDPITIKLPDPPPLPTIDGYGLPARDQYFTRAKMPARLMALEERAIENLRIIELGARHETVTGQKILEEIWRLFEEGKHNYKAEIEWVQKQIYFVLNGYWCYINGKPTYIDGWQYAYNNFWLMLDVTKNDGYPEYRDRDRRIYHFARYCFTTTEDEKGNDVGFRTCLGFMYSKHRRDGATYKFLLIGYLLTIFKRGAHFGIQSFDDSNAAEHYNEKLIPAWQNIVFFLRPQWQGSNNPRGELNFKLPAGRAYGKALGAKISYATTSNRKFYDGKKLYYYQAEEEGKCFGFGTEILMHKGGFKQVQDIIKGDVLMGDDSTPRNVLSVTSGEEEMVRVIPTKWEPFECNMSHILSLQVSDKRRFKPRGVGDVINMTVKEYLGLSKTHKKSLSLYKKEVKYPCRKHKLDPYFLGLWSGDGDCRSQTITNIDPEIGLFLKEYANKTNTIYTETTPFNRCLRIRLNTPPNKPNPILNELRRLNVIENKHIPLNYKIDSLRNKRKLLAGIIDSDGHRGKDDKKMVYEITQKNKRLAYDIAEVANSSGFHCSVCEKIATMKRKDGSVYKCLVYRLRIYGFDLFKIPCLIKRKKYKGFKRNMLARNPLRTGFVVKEIGVGKYYGFTIDRNRLFFIKDYIVAHNTILENIYERWGTMKPCLSTGDSAIIHGFSTHPSTVSDMVDQGGMNFYYLSEDSKFNERDEVKKQTISGLFRLFIPAWDGLEGYIGPYGESIIGEPTPEQAAFIKKTSGAKKQITTYRKMLLDKGTPEAKAKYFEHIALFPTSYAECFRITAGKIGFDEIILDLRIEELRRKIMTVSGYFDWEDGIVDSRVVFIPQENGRWNISKQLSDSEANLRHRSTWFNPITGEDETVFTPTFPTKYTLGCDPYQFSLKGEIKLRKDKSTMSDGGGSVYRERDPIEDPGDIRSEWTSEGFVATYRHRSSSDDAYAEDMLMAAVYYGGMTFSENNIAIVNKHFIKRGYAGYLKYSIDEITGRRKENPGYYMGGGTKMEMMNLMRNYIAYRGHKENHLKLLIECKSIQGIEMLTNFDMLASAGAALMGSKSSYAKVIERAQTKVDNNIIDAFPIHRY